MNWYEVYQSLLINRGKDSDWIAHPCFQPYCQCLHTAATERRTLKNYYEDAVHEKSKSLIRTNSFQRSVSQTEAYSWVRVHILSAGRIPALQGIFIKPLAGIDIAFGLIKMGVQRIEWA
jgi:hypothetical protein